MPQCHQCQRELPADAAGGVCPTCVLGFARGGRPVPATAPAPTMQRGPDVRSREVVYPTVAELNMRLPQFRFFEMVGSGGMGAVYKALQVNLDRPVAIKIMSPEVASDPSFAERFTREAKTLARLSHHNIVNVYDFGFAGDLYYLVMEYVDGVNLRQAIREGKINAAEALAVVPQVCEALQFAHDEGIIHRDIKPENILLDRRGRVKIADFGLAKLMANESHHWTLTGSRQVLGTVNYMAPEQMERPTDVDHRADIYSLGVVLYELLTGELPLGRFQLPGEKNAGWAALDEVVVRTLEKQPDRRFQRASEFKTAVEHACSQSGFRPIGPQRPELPSPGFDQRAATAPPRTSDPRGHRVPFTIENPWHGMTVTHGVLKSSPNGLLVDYSKREQVFQSQIGAPGQYEIPFDWIIKMDVVEGWFAVEIVMTMDSPRDLPGLHSETPGELSLKIKPEDLDAARALTNEVRRHNRQPLLPIVVKKPEELQKQARNRLQGPAVALMFAGIVNLVVPPILLILMFTVVTREIRTGPEQPATVVEVSRPMVAPPQVANSPAPAEQAVVLEAPADQSGGPSAPPATSLPSAATQNVSTQFAFGPMVLNLAVVVIWGIVGGLIISGAASMLAVRHWGWCLAMSIVALVPFHPGFIIGLPAGICSLVQLSRYQNREQFRVNEDGIG